jgi:hypothetical protein
MTSSQADSYVDPERSLVAIEPLSAVYRISWECQLPKVTFWSPITFPVFEQDMGLTRDVQKPSDLLWLDVARGRLCTALGRGWACFEI